VPATGAAITAAAAAAAENDSRASPTPAAAAAAITAAAPPLQLLERDCWTVGSVLASLPPAHVSAAATLCVEAPQFCAAAAT